MPTCITTASVLRWFVQFAQILSEKKDELTALDAAIGDADHGVNMNRGFQAVLTKCPGLEGRDLGEVFKTVAMTLISSVGGASGPLYGTFFLQAGAGLTGKTEASAAEFANALEKGLAGVMQRGKAVVGDKTMIDALEPAVKRFKELAGSGALTPAVLSEVADLAEEKARSTTPLQARKGRASYLGERSQGHQDPGATSTAYLFSALAQTMGP